MHYHELFSRVKAAHTHVSAVAPDRICDCTFIIGVDVGVQAAHKVVDVSGLARGIAVGQRVVRHKVNFVQVDELLGDDPRCIGDDLVHPPAQQSVVHHGLREDGVTCTLSVGV